METLRSMSPTPPLSARPNGELLWTPDEPPGNDESSEFWISVTVTDTGAAAVPSSGTYPLWNYLSLYVKVRRSTEDADSDKLFDGWELRYAGNLNTLSNPFADEDLGVGGASAPDGLYNLAEAILGTNPFAPDTDGDGVSDLVEHNQGTNPLDARKSLPVIPGAGVDERSVTVTVNQDAKQDIGKFTLTPEEGEPMVWYTFGRQISPEFHVFHLDSSMGYDIAYNPVIPLGLGSELTLTGTIAASNGIAPTQGSVLTGPKNFGNNAQEWHVNSSWVEKIDLQLDGLDEYFEDPTDTSLVLPGSESGPRRHRLAEQRFLESSPSHFASAFSTRARRKSVPARLRFSQHLGSRIQPRLHALS